MGSKLFSPIDLRDLALANRIVVSPMCQYSASEGSATDWHLMHLGQFALSGVGLLIVEMTNVEARGRISPYCMGLYNDDNERALTRVIEFCRKVGQAKLGVQLAHAGRKASTRPPWQAREPILPDAGGWQTVAPSAIPVAAGAPAPKALTREEIAALVQAFAQAAERAQRIGFDAIELHSAHGYLLHEFLSPVSNRRQDEYGGSRENRMRFPLEVFDAVRAVWPAEKPLGVRLSAIDWIEGGWTLDDTIAYVKALQARGCDWIDASSGGIVPTERISVGPGYQLPFAERIRAETGITTIAIGMITKPRQAEDIIATGKADMVAMARGMLYDPRWAWHAAAELGAEAWYPNQYLRCRPSARADVFADKTASERQG